MNEETEKILIEKVSQMHVVLLGIPDTSEGGLVKDVKCIREECARHRAVEIDHSKAIAIINGRCLERARNQQNQGALNASSKARRQATILGIFVILATMLSASIYGIIELIKL